MVGEEGCSFASVKKSILIRFRCNSFGGIVYVMCFGVWWGVSIGCGHGFGFLGYVDGEIAKFE